MKVVFLDFDGPIIPLLCYQKEGSIFTPRNGKAWPSCIEQLNRVTDVTGAKIVVSSTWRMDGLMKNRERLRGWGVQADCIGVTPVLHAERGIEIQQWLDTYDCDDVDDFVIFDDDKDMAHLMPRLIHTPFETGITEAHADQAIEMLKASH